MTRKLIAVLSRPENPRNVGAALRACVNFGVSSFRVVTPAFDWGDEERKLVRIASAGAWGLLEELRVYLSLPEALEDCRFVIGTSARFRAEMPLSTPAEIIATVSNSVLDGSGFPLAVVFGCESNGLTGAETDYCHALLSLQTNPAFSSLNLGQAVAVVMHSIVSGLGSLDIKNCVAYESAVATADDIERLIAMVDWDFNCSSHSQAQLRRLLMRSKPTQEDMYMLYNLVRRCKRNTQN